MTARFTLIAHAATEAQRITAFPLDEGVEEREIMKLAGLHWAVPRAERKWSAPEARAQQTSHALGLEAVIAEELRDCDYGRWRGRRMDEVQLEEPDGILAWLTDPNASPHEGESIDSLISRVGSWLDEQLGIKHTIAVSHPAVIRAAIIHTLRLSAQTFWRLDISPLSLTDIRFDRGRWTLRCAGCPLHLREQGAENKAHD